MVDNTVKKSLWSFLTFFSSNPSNDKTNNLFSLVNVGSIKYFKLFMLFWIVICDLYLLYFTVLLNLDFNCSKGFLSFSFGKVTNRTYNFVAVIWNSNPVGTTVAGDSCYYFLHLPLSYQREHNLLTKLKSVLFHN